MRKWQSSSPLRRGAAFVISLMHQAADFDKSLNEVFRSLEVSRSVFCLFLFPVRFQFPVATSLFPDFPVCRHCRQAPSVAPDPATPVASVAAAAPTAPTASTTSTIPLEEVSKAGELCHRTQQQMQQVLLGFPLIVLQPETKDT